MTTINITTTIERTYKNHGMHAEQTLVHELTGEIRKHDRVAYNVGSDIPEFNMSVKSSGATLMSARFCESEIKEEILNQFFTYTASSSFAFVIDDLSMAYVMNKTEFMEFCTEFGYTSRESTKNGGGIKVQFYKQSKRMIKWFEGHM